MYRVPPAHTPHLRLALFQIVHHITFLQAAFHVLNHPYHPLKVSACLHQPFMQLLIAGLRHIRCLAWPKLALRWCLDDSCQWRFINHDCTALFAQSTACVLYCIAPHIACRPCATCFHIYSPYSWPASPFAYTSKVYSPHAHMLQNRLHSTHTPSDCSSTTALA